LFNQSKLIHIHCFIFIALKKLRKRNFTMSEKKDKGEKPFPDNKAKPDYRTPVVVDLGELARGYGAKCTSGGDPGGKCEIGGSAAKCDVGSGF
jgi:hypothetical protein